MGRRVKTHGAIGSPRALTGLFLLLFLLSACLPPALPPVLKIGLVAPFEGRYRYVGYDAIYAARLAVREINERGGAGGYRLELVAYDDRGDAELAHTAAHNLAVDPAVVAVLGHYRQESTLAAQTIYAAAELPLLAIGAWPAATSAAVFSLAPSPERLAAGMWEAAAAPDAALVAVWGTGPPAAALESVLVEHGAQQSPGDSLLPELLFSLLPPHVTGERLVEWRAQGWRGLLAGGPELAATEFGAVAGAAAEGTCFVTPYPLPQDLLGTADWITAYGTMGLYVPEPGTYALPTYEAIYLLAQAITADVQTHGRPTRAGVTEALGSVKREGYLGTLRWSAAGYWDAAPLYLYCWEQSDPCLQRVLPVRSE
ncbi:MAG: ABC transporter substrate-binding protein [Chloroflexota bacterium]|nr:ABC transporter substrate-binding protein [Chloroflexota bacterium]